MKILMLGWELPPYNSGGLGVACYEMAKSLSLNGSAVDIDFVLPYTADHKIKEFKVLGATNLAPEELNVAAYMSLQDANGPASYVDLTRIQAKYTRFVENYLKSNKPDIIHAHDWLTFEAGMRAKALVNKPLIAHVHATEFDRAGSNFGNSLIHDIEYNGLLMADRIIAVSQVTKDIITHRYQIPGEKIQVIHNAINASEIAPETADAQTYVYLEQMKHYGYTVIVSLGRLTMQKGLSFLLEALEKASRKNDKLILLLAGSGEQRDELIDKAASLGIADKVMFTGFIRGKSWRDAYTVGDMFVMSSVSEPFGLTALEAAAFGNALLISKQSGVGEALNSALRFDFWDIDKLANQILAIAEQPSLSQELIQNARYEISHLDWQKVAKKCMNVYQTQLGASV